MADNDSAALWLAVSSNSFADAFRLAEARLAVDGRDPEPHLAKADLLGRMGLPDAAVESYGRAYEFAGGDTHCLARMGDMLWRFGRKDEAETILGRLVREAPSNPWILQMQLEIALERNNGPQVRKVRLAMEKAKILPDAGLAAWGLALNGEWNSGEEACRKALLARPELLGPWEAYVRHIAVSGRGGDALSCLARLPEILDDPRNVFERRVAGAVAASRIARESLPENFADGIDRILTQLRSRHMDFHRKLDRIFPCQKAILIPLGDAALESGDKESFERAMRDMARVSTFAELNDLCGQSRFDHYRSGLVGFAHEHPAAAMAVGDRLLMNGWHADAMKAYGLMPEGVAKFVRQNITIPPFFESADERDAYFEQMLSRLLSLDVCPAGSDPWSDDHCQVGTGTSLFFLPFMPVDPIPLLRAIHGIYERIYPDLRFVSPHLNDRARKPAGGLPRIAFVATNCQSATTVCYVPLLAGLADLGHEVVLFRRLEESDNEHAARLERAATRTVILPDTLREARQAIARENPDVLYNPLLRARPDADFLALSRLAPVQVTDFSDAYQYHSGLDYRLSLKGYELNASEKEYAEFGIETVLFDEMMVGMEQPIIFRESASLGRKDLEWPLKGHLYFYPQRLDKLQPEYDGILFALLDRDARGHVCLIAGYPWPQIGYLVRRRIERQRPDLAKRIIWLPRLTPPQFDAAMRLADVVLDSRPYGGGRSNVVALLQGTPVVTWPDERRQASMFMAWLLRRVGLDKLVAGSFDDFVDTCISLASRKDAAFAARIRAAVSGALRKNAIGRETSEFLCRAAESCRYGRRHGDA